MSKNMIEIVESFVFHNFFQNIGVFFLPFSRFTAKNHSILLFHQPVSLDLILAVKILQRTYFLPECVD